MTNDETKKMCLSLLRADSEEDVIKILEDKGYWDESKFWRYYGDIEDNFSTIGAQQSGPDYALVERVVNAVDAVLMGECQAMGLVPDSPAAPKSIYEAVALYFGGDATKRETLGHICYWDDKKRTEVSRRITIAATGERLNPCFTISDDGEGQMPNVMPTTLLDLRHKNKLRVHFVQGKFNMGSTGVFQFCGRYNLQLIISKRNPSIVTKETTDQSANMWGFTVIRRELPKEGRKMSVYTYLAPVGANQEPGGGGVLSFHSEKLPIFPEGRNPYKRESNWGTVIKLYDYKATGFRTNMMLRDGLLSRLDILLPEIALPIRLHECRNYKGHAGSFETTLCGLNVRLEDNKADNLEDGFPASSPLTARGEPMTAKIYAFRKGKAETYRKNEGIIFTVNGQTHGHLPASFFSRKNVGMGRLDDSILLCVDCSKLSGEAREDLFMNSRDRLRSGDLREDIERELEIIVRDHQGLRDLREKRRREEVTSKLSQSKPLEDILVSILKSSPSLASLFVTGTRLPNPFKVRKVVTEDKPYKGRRHPSYFKFRDINYGEKLKRITAINMRSRIMFETDAENDYFDRLQNKGMFILSILNGNEKRDVSTYSLNLQNGIATLNLRHPAGCAVGDVFEYEAKVIDETLIEPFVNRFVVEVGSTQEIVSGGGGGRRRPASSAKGKERELPDGLALPEINEVYEPDWERRKHKFDKYSALEIIQEEAVEDETSGSGGSSIYSFWVNMDNIYLKTEMKSTKKDPAVLKSQFKWGMALIGMALIQADSRCEKTTVEDEETRKEETESGLTQEDQVYGITVSIAPVILPLIESLGALTEDDVIIGSQVGDND